AEIVLMPHVTGCLPSPMPGRGTVDPEIWHNRERDPVRCRQEFDGPKGRGWIMRWLPARCWENGVFGVYSNPIGVESGTIKPGGEYMAACFGVGLCGFWGVRRHSRLTPGSTCSITRTSRAGK